MKRQSTLPAILALCCLAAFPRTLNAADVAVATVNGEAIRQPEFDRLWGEYLIQEKSRLDPSQMTPQWQTENKNLLLNQMIEHLVIIQEARKRFPHISKEKMEAGIAAVKNRFKSQKEFEDQMAAQHVTEQGFESHIEDDLRVVALTDDMLKNNVKKPTEEEEKSLFDKIQAVLAAPHPTPAAGTSRTEIEDLAQYYRLRTAEQVRIRHILFHVDPKASPSDRNASLEKARDVKKQINSGTDFSLLAKKYSDDTVTAQNGGDAGWIARGQMVKQFEDSIFSVPVGSVSGIITTPLGYDIVRVEEKKAAVSFRWEDVKSQLGQYLMRTAAREEFARFTANLIKNSKIDIRADFARPS